jgi:hypothetical protein
MASQFPPTPPKEYQDDLQRSQLDKNFIPPSVRKAMNELPPEKAYRNAANNFYTIAGLSLLNSIIAALGTGFVFVIGLGITQLIDAVVHIAKANMPGSSLVLTAIGLFFDIVICAVIAIIGYLTSKGNNWSLITGMILYALDAILVLFFKDWIGFAFHLFFLWQIWMIYRVLGYWKKLDKRSVDSFPQNIGTF